MPKKLCAGRCINEAVDGRAYCQSCLDAARQVWNREDAARKKRAAFRDRQRRLGY